MSIATKPDHKIVAAQKRTIMHNPVIDLVLGRLAEGVTVENGTAARGGGRIPIRVYRPSDTGEPVGRQVFGRWAWRS